VSGAATIRSRACAFSRVDSRRHVPCTVGNAVVSAGQDTTIGWFAWRFWTSMIQAPMDAVRPAASYTRRCCHSKKAARGGAETPH
jgi:hypothetical protein